MNTIENREQHNRGRLQQRANRVGKVLPYVLGTVFALTSILSVVEAVDGHTKVAVREAEFEFGALLGTVGVAGIVVFGNNMEFRGKLPMDETGLQPDDAPGQIFSEEVK